MNLKNFTEKANIKIKKWYENYNGDPKELPHFINHNGITYHSVTILNGNWHVVTGGFTIIPVNAEILNSIIQVIDQSHI